MVQGSRCVGRRRRAARLVVAAAGIAIVAATQAPAGVVVSEIRRGSVAERSGMAVGDRLSEWRHDEAGQARSGVIGTPLDLAELETERAPLGTITLRGTRAGEPIAFALAPDDWGFAVHAEQADAPSADDGLSAALEQAEAAAAARRFSEARAMVAAAVTAAKPSPSREAHVRARLADALRRAGPLDLAAEVAGEALALRRSGPADSLALAASLQQIGMLAYARGKDQQRARAGIDEARRILETRAPRSVAMARTLHALGCLSLANRDEAREHLRRALALDEELVPDSLTVAETLQALSEAAATREEKETLVRRALALRERWAPDGMEVAESLNRLAVALIDKGEPALAEEYFERVRGIYERLAPGTRELAGVLSNIANRMLDRSDLAGAENLYRRALAIMAEVSPESIPVAIRLNNLGHLLRLRRDFPGAEDVLAQARRIVEKEAPRGDLAPYLYANLANLARDRGDLAGAEAHLRRAAELVQSLQLGPAGAAYVELQLAETLARQKRLAEARERYASGLATLERAFPRTLNVAQVHQALAELALDAGDLEAAERDATTALEIRRERAPESLWEAESTHTLGKLARRRGRREEALALFRTAVSAFESQGRRLGGSIEVRTAFRAHYQELYRDLEELLLELERPEEAFAAVERSRARGLLAVLASRELDLRRDLPPELEEERRRADAEHDRVLSELRAPRLDASERRELGRRLEESRRAQDEVRARIRARAPRAAALRDPEPLDLAGVRRTLEAGTLLLVYSVGKSAVRVYSIERDAAEVDCLSLPTTGEALRADVSRFRELIAERRTPALRAGLDAAAERLGRTLLAPLAPRLRRVERLLIVPDGVLHLLPFSALRLPTGRYLVEAKPLQLATSITAWAALGAASVARGGGGVVGFGDPLYPGSAGPARAASLTPAVRGGLRLDPLPWTRDEVAALEALAPGQTRVFVGAEATEERARTIGVGPRVVHFACHGFLDEEFPLESGLALTIPGESDAGRENGLLQAFEVFEGVRLDADLVTLSACRTGLGRELAGEGLLGLTWAFHYAGARSVLASLWEVSDASTAELMRRFYAHLAKGARTAEALRAAQLELLRRPRTAAPFFWSAFQLVGGAR